MEQVVLDHAAYGWDADEIHSQHPYLTLGQIHGALAYYYDHREAMDREIEEGRNTVQALQEQHDDTQQLREKLRARGRSL